MYEVCGRNTATVGRALLYCVSTACSMYLFCEIASYLRGDCAARATDRRRRCHPRVAEVKRSFGTNVVETALRGRSAPRFSVVSRWVPPPPVWSLHLRAGLATPCAAALTCEMRSLDCRPPRCLGPLCCVLAGVPVFFPRGDVWSQTSVQFIRSASPAFGPIHGVPPSWRFYFLLLFGRVESSLS